MYSPTPRTPLTGHCSAIQNNSLYVYSSEAFQVLPITTNATWSQLPGGVPVTGAACVSTNDSLWVVGGIPTSDSSDFTGLQKFTFDTKIWETITPVVQVTQNRQRHAAVYLSESKQILIYGGSSNTSSTLPTTETFLLSTQAPYRVQSYTAKNIPVSSPLLLAWDESSAITLGGAATNANIYRFQPSTGWGQIKPSLPGPLKSADQEQATLIQSSDDSKVLQLFDLSVTPTNVTQIVLQRPNGLPARVNRTIGTPQTTLGGSHGTKRKRELTLGDWPSYNFTNAPTMTRSGFALAKSNNGVVAITGGGDLEQSVALFNVDQNAWVNTTSYFGASAVQQPLVPSRTPTSTPSSKAAASSTDHSHHRTELILGAVLGSVLGFIAILLIILCCVRWRRKKAAKKEQDEDEVDDEDDEKDALSFVDRGDPMALKSPTIEYPFSPPLVLAHDGQPAQGTLMDYSQMTQGISDQHPPLVSTNQGTQRQGQDPWGSKVGHQRSDTRTSERSTTQLVPKTRDTYEMSPIMDRARPATSRNASNTLQVPGAQQRHPRSTGWSRYFSGVDRFSIRSRESSRSSKSNGTVTSPQVGVGPGSPSEMQIKKSSGFFNHIRNSREPSQLPPLEMGRTFEGEEAEAGAQEDNRRGSSIRESDERPRTMSSNFSRPSTEPSWTEHDVQEQTGWTPMTTSNNDWSTNPQRPRDTATSSIYTSASPNPMSPPTISFTSPQMHHPSPIMEENEDPRRSMKATVERVVNQPVVQYPSQQSQQAATHSDLSWLNLGTTR